MKKSYTLTAGVAQRLRQLGLTALLAGGATVAAQAQFNYTVAAATNVTSTFTDLSTVTGSTVIATANTDDANSAAQDIGFTFNYNGVAFTQFVLNTNGLIRLGASAPSSAAAHSIYAQTPELGPSNSTNAADVNLIMPFNIDLVAGTAAAGASYRVAVTGTAPNRVCTIQWSNVSDKATNASSTVAVSITPQVDNFSFQVKLYETSNQVDFVYGPSTAGVGTSNAKYVAVGLKGSGSAAGQTVLATKLSTAAWSATTFFSGPYQTSALGNAHNVRQVAIADAGRTYRFNTAPANDAAVTAIYTYGKIATNSALPHAVQAVITNAGSAAQTNLVATLNVTGANTFTNTQTIATLAPGASATVTFAAYPATLALGTNTVTVTVPADALASNNTATYGQIVTADRVSYTNPSVTTVGGTVGVGQSGGALAAKYILPAPTVVTDVTLSFGTSTFASTNYQVVLYDATGTGGTPGTILYTSPTQTRTAVASTPVISTGGVSVPATFYIGIKELDNNPGLNYQTEDPLKPTTYYYSLDAATNWVSVNNTTLRTRLAIEFGTTIVNCTPPTALAVSNVVFNGATVTFTPPTTGTSGYQVIYGPTGFNPATGGTTVTATTSPVTLTGLTAATTYQVYVRSNCTAGGTSVLTTAVSFTTACAPNPTIATFPYTENFDTILSGQSLPCGITVLDANADGVTWRVSTEFPNSGTRNIRYQGLLASVAANDWFFTPGLVLPGTANTRYQVAFSYRAAGSGSTGTSLFTEALEVKSGTAATVAGQTNLLYTNNSINNLAYAQAGGASTPVVAYLPAGASTQYVGFHVISPALQNNLYIDDLSVTAVTITATASEALLRAVNVFPNPSASGTFNLSVNGANAQKGLEVEVVNNLGQRVYAGTARDNFTTQIDLSRLAGGLYHLKVKNGDEYMVRQISIMK